MHNIFKYFYICSNPLLGLTKPEHRIALSPLLPFVKRCGPTLQGHTLQQWDCRDKGEALEEGDLRGMVVE